VEQFEAEAISRRDERRLRLTRIHPQAYSFRQTAPDQMLALLDEGRQLARGLGEPAWELFFDYWMIETLAVYKGDYSTLIARGVRLVLEVRKPGLSDHPLRFDIFCTLVSIYLGVDPRGYASSIRETLAELGKQVPEEGSDRYHLRELLSWFAFELGHYDEARARCLDDLALLDADPDRQRALHHELNAYTRLCHVSFRRDDFQELEEFAEQSEERARRSAIYRFELALALLWSALVARRNRCEDRARRLSRQAINRVSRLGLLPNDEYFDALAAFHEAGGELDRAWETRTRELEGKLGKGQLGAEADCRLQRCRLLVLMGHPIEEEAAGLRQAASRLRDPTWHLTELERLLREGR
jgi:hypothetical protein